MNTNQQTPKKRSRRPNPIGYNIGGFKTEQHRIYPRWMVKACDRIAAKPDSQPLTNTEAEASIEYMDGPLMQDNPTQNMNTQPRRLFPNLTVWELSTALTNAGAEQAEKIRLAIRQRDPLSPDFVKPFKVPQITGKFTLKA